MMKKIITMYTYVFDLCSCYGNIIPAVGKNHKKSILAQNYIKALTSCYSHFLFITDKILNLICYTATMNTLLELLTACHCLYPHFCTMFSNYVYIV